MYSKSHEKCSLFCCVLVCCGQTVTFLINSIKLFAPILQICFADAAAIKWMTNSQSSNSTKYREKFEKHDANDECPLRAINKVLTE